MSPVRLGTTSGTQGFIYESPFIGPVDHQVAIEVDLTQFTDDEIDQDGYLKPGIPLTDAGELLGSGDFVFGVTIEEVKVADDNESATIAALGTQQVAIALICAVNRAVAEAMLGRAYTAAEAAGFNIAGSKCVLIPFTVPQT